MPITASPGSFSFRPSCVILFEMLRQKRASRVAPHFISRNTWESWRRGCRPLPLRTTAARTETMAYAALFGEVRVLAGADEE